ncbi:MAG: D-alanine--D-alanine ligase [Actinomycetales bacterium]|nr:D-alanine--D-alanine ligase [Actinomycetales bacterium]
MEKRVRVAVLFGGISNEHTISCISAGSVLRAIDHSKYEAIAVGITQSGEWVPFELSSPLFEMTASQEPSVQATGQTAQLVRVADQPMLEIQDDDSVTTVPVDVVFPVLHGTFGEDGTIQQILEDAQVPYVGSGVFASAACMDKSYLKTILRDCGFAVGEYEVITEEQWLTDAQAAITRAQSLGFPLFVKPCRAGSSVGISKVKSPAELKAAIELARQHDDKVIIEAGLENAREIECGVLGTQTQPRASVCAEIVVKGNHEFYDYEAKYLDDSAELIVPAILPEAVHDQARELAKSVFTTMECAGLARVDLFLLEGNSEDTESAGSQLIVNEVNTMPGFTSISMFPQMWQHTGLGYQDLISALIEDALSRAAN